MQTHTEPVMIPDVYDGTDAFMEVEAAEDGGVTVQTTFRNHLIDGGEFTLSLDLDSFELLADHARTLARAEGLY